MLKSTALPLLAALLVLASAGCGQEPLLRDDYMGRSWLEPSRQPATVERDARGDPVLSGPGRRKADREADG